MEKNKLVDLLCDLNSQISLEGNLSSVFDEKTYKDICERLNCTCDDIHNVLKKTTELYFSSELTGEWKYVCLNFYILHLINLQLESHEEVLSVQQSKHVKKCIKNVVTVGILTKLQPNLPLYVKSTQSNSSDIFLNYNILKCTTFGLSEFLKCLNIRLLILPDSLKAILVAIYQIGFCPLKKPSTETTNNVNVMTEDMYKKLVREKELFLTLLENLRKSIHPGIFVKETMVILHSNAPTWFKRSVSQSLTSIIRSENGVQNIALALLDGANNDSSQTWMILDVFSKLILSCRGFPDFQDNICKQVIGILDRVTEDSLVFETVFVHCTKSVYNADQELGKTIFVRKVVSYFLYFTYKDHKFGDGETIAYKIKQHVRLIHGIFTENTVESPGLPLEFLKSIINVIFRLYTYTLNTSFVSTNTDLKDILTAYLNSNINDLFVLFDCFLFGINSKELLAFRSDIVLKIEKDDIVINYSQQAVGYSVAENSECLLNLLKNNTNLMVKLFGFLLNCLTHRDNYFKKANEDLLNLETNFMNEYVEKNIVVYKLLSDLAEDKNIQKRITEDPGDIVRYIDSVLRRTIETSTHKTREFESEGFQSVFTIIMILQQLVKNCSKGNLKAYKILTEPLNVIVKETSSEEIKNLINQILNVVEKGNIKSTRMVVEEVKTELDKAIEDICDSLLPVRGHGLMVLTKLVEKKEKCVLDRKQYVLNIFQGRVSKWVHRMCRIKFSGVLEDFLNGPNSVAYLDFINEPNSMSLEKFPKGVKQNLKNEDSFIYLSAIGGLTAMADVFPDTVLNTLCEEYSDSSRKNTDDAHEVRMKLGESLVRVTKLLGDMAPKYKPLLLNTFLLGAKDDDYLIRASSLSNLGEICRVLGYKLGTIINEVLVCIHAIIATDKSLEARRAAVTVIRQLFIGLDNEMIAFLKDDILPIYRTLKEIYSSDKDDVMRLQAQLALEELNENMKNFVFPNPQLNEEKKVLMLN